MKNFGFLLLFIMGCAPPQGHFQSPRDQQLYELARRDLKGFAEQLSQGTSSELEKTRRIIGWLSRHFDWTATDYKQRTVQQIIDRRGGNCNELAMVAVAALEKLHIPMRRVHEINIYSQSARRGKTARTMVRQKGNSYSVFGRHHNDHIWLEIHDSRTNQWYPADPSLGLVGEEEWLKARVGFGPRHTLDPGSADMIVPFAVFAADSHGNFTVNRTRHYLVDGFNRLYKGQLQSLKDWKQWVQLLGSLEDKAMGAFQGRVNLLDYSNRIDQLAAVYAKLRSEYRERSPEPAQ